jgi:hypothetical protein
VKISFDISIDAENVAQAFVRAKKMRLLGGGICSSRAGRDFISSTVIAGKRTINVVNSPGGLVLKQYA